MQSRKMQICCLIATVAALAICLSLCIPPALADATFPHEYRIKAAYMYNFLKFIQGWKFQQETDDKEQDEERPIIIGIIGKDPFDDAFAPLAEKQLMGRSFTVKRFKGLSQLDTLDEEVAVHPDIENIKLCDMLFVCSSENRYIDNILTPIRSERILTVADTPGFLDRGGIINFTVKDNKVHFEINTKAAGRANFRLRSQLIRLARNVIDEDDVAD